MSFLRRIIFALVLLSFPFAADAQIVTPPVNQIIVDQSRLPQYIVLTPKPSNRRNFNPSAFNDTVRGFIRRGTNLPENSEIMDDVGWDGSISFRVKNSKSVEPAKRSLERFFKTRGAVVGDFETRVDGIRFPVSATQDQWLHQGPAVEKGGANTKDASITETGRGVTVAVIDTGWIDHPYLKKAGGYDFISDDRSSNDADSGRDADPTDEGDYRTSDESPRGVFEASSWHGAHVQGIIASKFDVNTGFQGIAPDANVLPVRVLGRFGGRDQDIVDAIAWSIGITVGGISNPTPANIINLSLGAQSDVCPEAYKRVFSEARARGVVIVVAAGNDEMDSKKFTPANCENVILVSSNTREGRLANYSNFGTSIDISAPGGETFERFLQDGKTLYRSTPQNGIVSTVSSDIANYNAEPNSFIYKPYQGTSMAAPVISGVIALMQEAALKSDQLDFLSPETVEAVLKKTARSFPSTLTMRCDRTKCGAGIVDAVKAINDVKSSSTPIVIEGPQKDKDIGKKICLSSYEIIERLLGEDEAAKFGAPDDQNIGKCLIVE